MFKKLKSKWSAIALLFCVALISTGCSTLRERADIKPPQRKTFFNFYKVGLQYAKQQSWESAATNFRIALGEKEGAQYGKSKDQERIRTYGMHFESNYYPNRELGICLYHLAGKAEDDRATELYLEAYRYLSRSLDQQPSQRAKDYVQLLKGKVGQ